MRFFVGAELLARAPEYMVALVVARFAVPLGAEVGAWAAELLSGAQASLAARLAPLPAAEADAGPAAQVRADPRVAAWRAAQTELGLNPNRFPSSIEALATRVLKGGRVPSVGPLVDLANVVALRHLVPVGAHDLDAQTGDLRVDLSRGGEPFALDGASNEVVPSGEPIYADAEAVRTRRWVWRQGATGRVTGATTQVFFPIDGFRGQTDGPVLAAAQDLLDLLSTLAPDALALYRVDGANPAVELAEVQPTGEPDIRALPLTQDVRAHFVEMIEKSAQQRGAGRPPEQEQTMTIDERVIMGLPGSTPPPDEEGIRDVLERGVEIIEVREDLEKALRSGRQLRIKLGIDPTGPRIHIGRAVTLRKMRQFERLGHLAVLIVGDLTAQVGDASGHNEERPMLTPEAVRENMRNYAQQIGMIVDLDQAEFQYNSTWLNKLDFKDVVDLAKHFTVAQMIQRENFRNRWEEGAPIGLHELLYPLMQGYDSLAIKADVELGGTDQLFNVMAGRKIQEALGQHPQNIVLVRLIPGLDGRKMSTTWGNGVYINDAPVDQYGKIMSVSDPVIPVYLESCTDLPMAEVRRLSADLEAGQAHPMEIKKLLAHQIVKEYHGADAANFAQAEFEKVVQGGGAPSEVPAVTVPATEFKVVDLLLLTGQAPSKGQARRVIEQGGVEIDDARITDMNATLVPRDGMLIKFGKRSFVRLDVH